VLVNELQAARKQSQLSQIVTDKQLTQMKRRVAPKAPYCARSSCVRSAALTRVHAGFHPYIHTVLNLNIFILIQY
jgi:hypothetical protein